MITMGIMYAILYKLCKQSTAFISFLISHLDDAWESDRQDLLSELSIMKKLPRHRHVVKLLGCVTTSGILIWRDIHSGYSVRPFYC